jgi:hypothetical protein
MKKILAGLSLAMIMTACSNNGGESGAVDDGFKGAGDPNGGLPDSANTKHNPEIEPSKGEQRVDTERRDSTTTGTYRQQ